MWINIECDTIKPVEKNMIEINENDNGGEKYMYDVIIVGAGPAGLTSAIYTRRAEKKTLVLEAMSYGGQIINTLSIDNYPVAPHISGFDFATKLYEQAKNLGTEIVFEEVVHIQDHNTYKEVITNKNTYQTKTIILATGAKNRKLNLPNEKEFIGKGVSYCATCDGSFYRGKEVAIQGGGNTALEDALYLSDIAKKVYLIHRRDTFRADETLIRQLHLKENIELICNSMVTKLNGDEALESIVVTNHNGVTKTIAVAGLFIAIGRVPETENFNQLIHTDASGYIVAGEDCHTNVDGIYVAGDSRTKSVRQLVTATSDGAVAAIEAIRYLN